MNSIISSNFVAELRFWGVACRENQRAVVEAIQASGPISTLRDVQALIEAICGRLAGIDGQDLEFLAHSVLLWVSEQARTQNLL